jgi:4-hydroxybenzoyl-CoA reductase subunit alpha
VQLKLDRSGLVTVFCGSTDIGQGSDSVLAWIVGEVLGIDPLGICVVTGRHRPHAGRPRQLQLARHADDRQRRAAGRRARARADRAARRREARRPAQPARIRRGRASSTPRTRRGMPFPEAVISPRARFGTLGTVGFYTPPKSPGAYKRRRRRTEPELLVLGAVVEVDVDPETGIYKVPRVWMAHDIGRSINPCLVMGQIEGSVYMGLGEAMMEERPTAIARATLSACTSIPSMLDYKQPTSIEMPEVTYVVEDPDKNGPFGAKEVGQGPLLPMMPAVANAIFDAVGVRVDENPVSSEKVFAAMQSSDRARARTRAQSGRRRAARRVAGGAEVRRPGRVATGGSRPEREQKELAKSRNGEEGA